ASLIALAYRDWLLDDPSEARSSLDQCPPPYRNEEWSRLHWACHAEIATLRDRESYAVRPVFTPDGTGFLWVSGKTVKLCKGSDAPETLCEAPGDLWGAAVTGDGSRLTLLAKGDFRRPPGGPSVWERVVCVWDLRAGRWAAQWGCETPSAAY